MTNRALPEIPDDDADFTPDLARKIIAKYQELLSAIPQEPIGARISKEEMDAIEAAVTARKPLSKPIAQGQREAWLRWGLEEIVRCTEPRAGSGDTWIARIANEALRSAGFPANGAGIQKPTAALAPSAQEGETVTEWIAYADKLEKVIALCAKSSVDNLTRLHAEDGLRVVSHSRPMRGGAA